MKKAISLLVILLSLNSVIASPPFFPKLVVSGSAILHKPADMVELSISVLTQADTVEAALSDNNVKMQQVVASLVKAGLEKGEYETGQFAIQPIYSPHPKNPSPDWKPAIIAYEVTNNLRVHTQKLEHAPTIIDIAGRSGANKISDITFGIKDPETYRGDAISQATKNALQDANALAEAANLQLVRVLDIKLEQPPQIFPKPGPNMMYMAKVESAPFIQSPDVDVNATVSITFEIASS